MSLPAVDKFNIKIRGSASKTMLFGNGLGLDQNTWRLIAPVFEKQYRVVLFDYTGTGNSNHTDVDLQKYQSLQGYANDVIEICNALKLEDAIFIGHSISSMIGLLASLENPSHFERLIFIAPSPRYVNDTDGYQGGFQKVDVENIIKSIENDYKGWVKDNLPQAVNAPQQLHIVREVLDSFISCDQDMLRRFALATFFSDHRKDLLKFDKECLIIQTTDDIMAPLQVGDYLHAHLMHSSIKRLQSRGHFPQLTAPKELIAVIQSYLSNTNSLAK